MSEQGASMEAAPVEDKKRQAERVLSEVLNLMEMSAKLDIKDGADGGISVALHFEQEPPKPPGGRRSHVIDALQFLVNKIVNKPQTERRWINLGVGEHPAPRPASPAGRPSPAPESQLASPPRATPLPAAPTGPAGARSTPGSSSESNEGALDVPEDPRLSAAIRALAERSSKLGRYYAIAPMKLEDRARVLRAAAGVAGTTVHVEGEGRSRRVVFTPANPAPMPKRSLPVYDEEEDELADD